MPIASIIALALQILPLVTTAVPEFIAFINSLRSAAQQANEWTPDQEAAYRAALFAKSNDPAYKPDALAGVSSALNSAVAGLAAYVAAQPTSAAPAK